MAKTVNREERTLRRSVDEGQITLPIFPGTHERVRALGTHAAPSTRRRQGPLVNAVRWPCLPRLDHFACAAHIFNYYNTSRMRATIVAEELRKGRLVVEVGCVVDMTSPAKAAAGAGAGPLLIGFFGGI